MGKMRHGNYRRAHHGREWRNFRGGNCNPAGKAGCLSPKRTRERRRANHLSGERGARATQRLTLPAHGTHFVQRKGEKRGQPAQRACRASRNRPASRNACCHSPCSSNSSLHPARSRLSGRTRQRRPATPGQNPAGGRLPILAVATSSFSKWSFWAANACASCRIPCVEENTSSFQVLTTESNCHAPPPLVILWACRSSAGTPCPSPTRGIGGLAPAAWSG